MNNDEQKILVTVTDKILEKAQGKNKTDCEERRVKSKTLKMY